jgi:hypothetical protein
MAQVLYDETQLMPVIPPVRGWRWSRYLTKPCGTPAAARRHLRHNEPVCPQCKESECIRGEVYRAAVKANGGPLGGRHKPETPHRPG